MLQEIAFGEIGMAAKDFWNSTPREFHFRQKGYYRKVEIQERNNWERVRWIVYRMKTSSKSESKGGDISLQDIALFPWETKPTEKNNTIDPAIIKRMADAMDRHAKEPNQNGKIVPIGEILNK